MKDDATLRTRLARARYPRASRYDPRFLLDTMMGPNGLWLTEWLSEALPLEAGTRVLDLGCGKASSSIFLAREFGVSVTAADLWIEPDENAARIAAAGVADLVQPLRAEAHALPFGAGGFDAIVSVDAYHYFGTDDLYLGYLLRFLRPGGRLGIVVPGAREELGDAPPAHLEPWWDPDFFSFHSPAWWRRHWARTGRVAVETADWLEDGWRDWADWCDICAEHGAEPFREPSRREAEMVRADAGRVLGFVRTVARKPA